MSDHDKEKIPHNADDLEQADAGAAPSAEAAGVDARNMNQETVMPNVTFSTFVLSLASSALMCLGEVPEPESGATSENIPLARHTIDVLCMLDEKIKNGLDADEARLLEGILYELRMKFVMKSQ